MLRTLMLFAITVGLYADPVNYAVTVDTSSISGTSGNIDFQFNPGFGTFDPAFVTILSFASDGTLAGSPMVMGDVTGTLPPGLTIQNTTGLNDYTEGFTFGNTLSFLVTFGGQAITSPSGTATAGSTFAFSLFNSDFSSALLTTDAVNGALVEGDVDTQGHIAVTNLGVDSTTDVSPVPEPAWAGTIAAGLLGLAIAIKGYREYSSSRR